MIFEETSAPKAAVVAPRQANSVTMTSSGASDAIGATHWTSRNSLIPNSCPVATSDSPNGCATSRMNPADRAPRTATIARRCRLG